MKFDNLFTDSCPLCCTSQSPPVFKFTPVGAFLESKMLSVCNNTELWIGVCSVGY